MTIPWVAAEIGGITAATVAATGSVVGFTVGEISALVAAVTASALAILAAVVTLIKAVQSGRAVEAMHKDVNEVHVLVDGRMSKMVERVEQLTAVLETSDKPVPAAHTGPLVSDPVMVERVEQLTVALEGSDTPVPDPPALA